MSFGQYSGLEILLLVQHELLLFAAVFFALGALDEIIVDGLWLGLRATGRMQTPRIDEAMLPGRLAGPSAIFIPAWHEAAVIGPTLTQALRVWPHAEATFYVGCYANDPLTIAAAAVAARDDRRVRLVINDELGPTTKPACLNRLYEALCLDEERHGSPVRMVVLHDAEDLVDAAALPLLDAALCDADFVQLPVLALPRQGALWIGGHYSDEFAEAHARTMMVRSALGAALPGAGVGCAVARPMLARLAAASRDGQPFARTALTEDYELGLRIAASGGRSRFLRVRCSDGRLIATRAFFPDRLEAAVRQKARWVHGIALQGWDRLGWWGSPLQQWMQLRDRRGPFAAALLALAYALLILVSVSALAVELGLVDAPPLSPLLRFLLVFNFCAVCWRAVLRGIFTAREFGWRQGLVAIPRLIVSNVVAIMAGRRAVTAYLATLRGAPVVWDKTEHRDHPVFALAGKGRA